MFDNLAYFIEGVWGNVVILTNQVRDSFQKLHKIQLLLVTPALVCCVFAGNSQRNLKIKESYGVLSDLSKINFGLDWGWGCLACA